MLRQRATRSIARFRESCATCSASSMGATTRTQGGGTCCRHPVSAHRMRQESGTKWSVCALLRWAEPSSRSLGRLAASDTASVRRSRAQRRASAKRSRRARALQTVRAGRSRDVRRARKSVGSCFDHRGFLPESGCPRRVRLGQAARRTEGTTCRVCDGFTAVGLTGFICTSLLSVARISADNLVHSTRHILHDNPVTAVAESRPRCRSRGPARCAPRRRACRSAPSPRQ